MNKLALSVVVLMVAGAGAATAVGCSSSSSTGTGGSNDSGTTSDVTTPTGDTGTGSGGDSSTTEDTGSNTEDSGTGSTDSAAPTCTTDASLTVGSETDAGYVVNAACTACINGTCGMAACPCLTDTEGAMTDDAGNSSNACLDMVGCVEGTVGAWLAANADAGSSAEATEVVTAEMACQSQLMTPSASESSAKTLVGCVVLNCATACE
jgi:hypothetical protein